MRATTMLLPLTAKPLAKRKQYFAIFRNGAILFASLFAVAVLGMANLLQNFNGDQALFVVYAEQISHGALLYRDVWDLKQPGVFLFYLCAGRIFGFTETGVHLFELLYWLIFSVFLVATLKKYFRQPLFACLTPLLTVGFYYAICGSWHLTQIEALASFPIYAALIAAIAATNTKNQKIAACLLCLSGIAGGIVIICKLIFLPIVVCFWLTTLLVLEGRSGKLEARIVTAAIAAIAVGFALPLILVAVYFARFGALEIVGYTFFEYPVRAVAAFADTNRRSVLDEGLHWFLRSFATLLLLIAVAGLLAAPSPKTIRAAFANGSIRNFSQAHLLTVNLILWLFAGFAVVLAQCNSWWEYHYLLMFAPLGILAAKSIETIWRRAAQTSDFFIKPVGQFAFAVCVGVLFVPTARLAIKKFDDSIVAQVNSPPENLWTARGDQDEQYQTAAADIEFLSQPTARSGAIFVCGSPLYYHLSRRAPALASNGWMPELFLPAQWEQLAEELSAKLPQYVFVDNGCSDLIIQKSPRIVRLLADNYRVRSRSGKMRSYELAFEIGKTE